MKDPTLNGPPSAIWRKITVTNFTNEGVFSLFFCERTNSAVWVPTGDFFVADKPKETTRTSVLDFVTPNNPRQWFSERNIYIPSKYNSFARRYPIVQPELKPAGSGSKGTITRRIRHDKNNKKWLNKSKTLQNNNSTVSGPSLPASFPAPSSSTSSSSLTTTNSTITTQPTLTFLDPTMQNMAMLGLDEDGNDLSHMFM